MSKAAVHNNKAYAPFPSQRVRPKDAIDLAKQDGVVYKIPCGGGKVFIGESGRPTQVRTKEHDRDIRLANNWRGLICWNPYDMLATTEKKPPFLMCARKSRVKYAQ